MTKEIGGLLILMNWKEVKENVRPLTYNNSSNTALKSFPGDHSSDQKLDTQQTFLQIEMD